MAITGLAADIDADPANEDRGHAFSDVGAITVSRVPADHDGDVAARNRHVTSPHPERDQRDLYCGHE